jgi:hypothetical protein
LACNTSKAHNADPKHDFSSETGEPLNTNDNELFGETFYMKLPAYDGDYLANTESGVVVECPECVPALTYTHPTAPCNYTVVHHYRYTCSSLQVRAR